MDGLPDFASAMIFPTSAMIRSVKKNSSPRRRSDTTFMVKDVVYATVEIRFS